LKLVLIALAANMYKTSDRVRDGTTDEWALETLVKRASKPYKKINATF
jgi:hypothetical protein